MLKVGLTGNFFSGFDDAADCFEKIGVPVFDADLIIRFMLNHDRSIKSKVQSKLGRQYYKDGLLDFTFVETHQDFENLFSVIEFDLIKAFETWRIKQKINSYVIFKSSILYERKLSLNMNLNIHVYRPKMYRKTDCQQLTKIPAIRLNYILDNEMDELEKNSKSDYVIHNYYYTDTDSNFIEKVKNIDRTILKRMPYLQAERLVI